MSDDPCHHHLAAKGKESGRNNEKVEIATNMKRLGVPTDMISQATGLSADEIDAI